MTRILLYTSEPVLARGLSVALLPTVDLRLVGVVGSSDDLAASLANAQPDILLLDVTSGAGIGLLRDLKKRNDCCKILLWVNGISAELAFQAMGLGVRGITRRTLPTEILMVCLRKVSQGETWFEKELTDSISGARKVTLTRREGQLVTLLTQGMKNKEIATTLRVSENTVKVYLSRLFSKVGVRDRFELAIYGLRGVGAEQTCPEPSRVLDETEVPQIGGLRSLFLETPAMPSWTA